MKPIPTHWKGYFFRSRLEARWAVFLETLQLHWRFEPQGFELPSGRYLPDFFLRLHPEALADHQPAGSGYWVEIKPDGEPSDTEKRLLVELARETGHNAFLVAGSPWPGQFDVWKALRDYGDGRPAELVLRERTGVYGGMPSEWLLCDRGHDLGFGVDPYDAYRRARGARFEHGERPGLPLGWEGIEPAWEPTPVERFETEDEWEPDEADGSVPGGEAA